MTLTPFLIWLVCVGIGAVFVGYLIRNFDTLTKPYKEGFVVGIPKCPANTTEYVDGQGRTMCCDRDLVDGKCPSIKCSLSAGVGAIPTCSQIQQMDNDTNATMFCPSSMPNYYNTGNQQGCSSNPVGSSGQISGKLCTVYRDALEARQKEDSCTLLKEMEDVKCPTTSSVRSIVSSGESGLPMLVACTYVEAKNVIPVTCYTRESAKRWAEVKYKTGDWEAKLKEKGLTLDTMINLCPS
jgi:hypothetical protein